MAFNLTGIDEDVYFVVSLVTNVSLFSVFVLPSLTLCLVCVLALILATEINLKIRVLLLNILLAEILNLLDYAIFYLGFPSRIAELAGDYSCHVFFHFAIVVGIQKFTATAIYAIMVYIFIKKGERKMKWSVIISFIVLSWILVSGSVGIFPYIPEFEILAFNGFCSINSDTLLFKISLIPFMEIPIVCMITIATFGLLLFIYIKKNTLEENVDVKKAVAKILLYLFVYSILTFIANVAPATFPVIRDVLVDESVISLIVINYSLRVIFNIPNIATPIVTIMLLKPLRVALKKNCCNTTKN